LSVDSFVVQKLKII